MKLFNRTVNNEIIYASCSYFKFSLPSELLEKDEGEIPKQFHATYWSAAIFWHKDVVC